MRFEDYMRHRRVNDVEEREKLRIAFEIISNHVNINRMIAMIDLGKSPLSAIVEQLENNLDCSDANTRQSIGRIITYVLDKYNFIPTKKRARVASFYHPIYFKTSVIYERKLDKRNKCYTMEAVKFEKKLESLGILYDDFKDLVKSFDELTENGKTEVDKLLGL